MANKARLRFQPIDYSYAKRYGKMPDYDFTDRLKAGQSLEEVSALIESRMAGIWAEEKAAHERQEACNDWQNVVAECPF